MPTKIISGQNVQIGTESTRGTAVAQTLQLIVEQDAAIMAAPVSEEVRPLGSDIAEDSTILYTDGKATIPFKATLEQLPVYLDGLLGAATPSGSDPYTRTYNSVAPGAFTTAPRIRTIAIGDSTDCYSLTGAVGTALSMVFEHGKYITGSAEFIGTNVETDSLDSLSRPAVTYLNGSQVVVSMGTIGGSLTALNCDALKAELMVNYNRTNRSGLGSLTACDYDRGNVEGEMKITALFTNSTVKAVEEAMLGTSPTLATREIRVAATSGSHSTTIDFTGYRSGEIKLHNYDNGRVMAELVFTAQYYSGSNLTSWLDITHVNATATNP